MSACFIFPLQHTLRKARGDWVTQLVKFPTLTPHFSPGHNLTKWWSLRGVLSSAWRLLKILFHMCSLSLPQKKKEVYRVSFCHGKKITLTIKVKTCCLQQLKIILHSQFCRSVLVCPALISSNVFSSAPLVVLLYDPGTALSWRKLFSWEKRREGRLTELHKRV